MSIYSLTLIIHTVCAAVSLFLFVLRGIWMLTDNKLLQAKVVRITPHVIDSALLLSAIALTVQTNQYPLSNAWLTVKIIALVMYILLGVVALKRGKTRKQRIVAFVLALITFAFIVSVALLHHPLGFFVFVT